MIDDTSLSPAIRDALAVARAHAAVDAVSVTSIADGRTVVELDINTQIGSRDRAAGQAANGVRVIEKTIITFGSDYPNSYPEVRLRADFNRALPHINPHHEGEPVPPCLLYGNLSELHHSVGFTGILEQLADWLKRAGRGKLIDLPRGDGWEPVRRDTIDDDIVFDPAELLATVSSKAGSVTRRTILNVHYEADATLGKAAITVFGPNQPINQKNVTKLITLDKQQGFYSGTSIACMFWGSTTDIVSEYLPETVFNFKQLRERAIAYGCGEQFNSKFDWLTKIVLGYRSPLRYPIVVLLCVRRPSKVLGTNANIEFLCYRIDSGVPTLLPDGENTPVRLVAHRHPLTTELLRRASGIDELLVTPNYTIIGCGSLGSKIAVHLARAGFQPSRLLDSKTLAPHNFARHALLPSDQIGDARFSSIKAYQLSRSLASFGKPPTGFYFDLVKGPRDSTIWEKAFPRSCEFIINTTASHGVRDRLTTLEGMNARVIEAALMNNGRVAILTVEGIDRNPNTADVMAATYEELRVEGILSAIGETSIAGNRIGIGQGCEAITIAMTDARLSKHAATISERLINWATGSLPDRSLAYVGRIETDGMSVRWTENSMEPTHVITAENDPSWEVRILERAHKKIVLDVSKHPRVETGGIIVGRVSPIRRTIWVTDVLDAPVDSRRSTSFFSLGVQNRQTIIEKYNQTAAGHLWCLGTWHSHLQDQGGSHTDYKTAEKLKGSIARAAVLLIRRPDGYSAVVEKGAP